MGQTHIPVTQKRRVCKHRRQTLHSEGPGYEIWRCLTCGRRQCRAPAQLALFSRAEAQVQLELFAA